MVIILLYYNKTILKIIFSIKILIVSKNVPSVFFQPDALCFLRTYYNRIKHSESIQRQSRKIPEK